MKNDFAVFVIAVGLVVIAWFAAATIESSFTKECMVAAYNKGLSEDAAVSACN